MGLLFKLRNKVKKEKKANPKLDIDFKWLINNSSLAQPMKSKAHNIRVMRNCYIHYQNIIAYNAQQHFVKWPEFVGQQKLLARDDPILLNTIESFSNLVERDYREETIPIQLEHLETNQEIIPFIEKRIKDHMNWVGSAASRLNTYKINHNDTTILTLQNLLLVYGVEAFDALTCIKWSFKVLKALYFF